MNKKKVTYKFIEILIAISIPVIIFYLTEGSLSKQQPLAILNPSTSEVKERFSVEWEPDKIKCKIKVYQKGTFVWNTTDRDRIYGSGEAMIVLAPSPDEYVLKLISTDDQTAETRFKVTTSNTPIQQPIHNTTTSNIPIQQPIHNTTTSTPPVQNKILVKTKIMKETKRFGLQTLSYFDVDVWLESEDGSKINVGEKVYVKPGIYKLTINSRDCKEMIIPKYIIPDNKEKEFIIEETIESFK